MAKIKKLGIQDMLYGQIDNHHLRDSKV